jgi:ferrous iron transport protein A
MQLHELNNGQSCKLVRIEDHSECYQRLLDLGFTAGEAITVVRKAPFGGPIQVQIRGTNYAVRKADACHIHVSL